MAEQDVNFIQLYQRGWDQHGNLPGQIRKQSLDTDQASAALVKDLKRRGMLEDTLVVWGGEFGRTNYSQGKLTKTNYGRDHHPKFQNSQGKFAIHSSIFFFKEGIYLNQDMMAAQNSMHSYLT